MEKNNYTKNEVLQLMYQAFESGFKKYEVVDAGLESMETKEECGWILRRYDSDLEKETQKQLITEIMNEDAKDGLYKKQTAVEWLFHQLWEEPKDKFTWYAILKKAKAMHKEEIVDAFGVGCQVEDISTRLIDGMSEQYYREKYGKDTNDNTSV